MRRASTGRLLHSTVLDEMRLARFRHLGMQAAKVSVSVFASLQHLEVFEKSPSEENSFTQSFDPFS